MTDQECAEALRRSLWHRRIIGPPHDLRESEERYTATERAIWVLENVIWIDGVPLVRK